MRVPLFVPFVCVLWCLCVGIVKANFGRYTALGGPACAQDGPYYKSCSVDFNGAVFENIASPSSEVKINRVTLPFDVYLFGENIGKTLHFGHDTTLEESGDPSLGSIFLFSKARYVLGQSRKYFQLRGTAPHRVAILSCVDYSININGVDTDLTAQIKVFESGRFEFHVQKLVATHTFKATVGVALWNEEDIENAYYPLEYDNPAGDYSNMLVVLDRTCGNGVVDEGEQCDGGGCCTNTCTFKDSSSSCPVADGFCAVCSGKSATCLHPGAVMITCPPKEASAVAVARNPVVQTPKFIFINSTREGACTPASVSNLQIGLPVKLSFDDETDSQCSFYADSHCSQAIKDNSDVVEANPYTFYAKCQETWLMGFKVSYNNDQDDVVSNRFQVVGYSLGGQVCGDPHFVGFDGSEFLFNGVAGHYYNILSDPHVVVNTKMINANGEDALSTVNGAIGIHTRNYNISLSVDGYKWEDASMMFMLNGKKMQISEGKEMRLDNDCLLINFNKEERSRHHHHTFSVSSKFFNVFVFVSEDHTMYVNSAYFDYFIDVDTSVPSRLGGLLGVTAGGDAVSDLDEAEFRVDDLLATTEKYMDEALCGGRGKRGEMTDCTDLPDGHHCTKDLMCASGRCSTRKVCEPKDTCFDNTDCSTGEICCLVNQCMSEADMARMIFENFDGNDFFLS